MNLLLVVLGGGVGAGSRYLLGGWLQGQLGNGFLWGTFAVNALGSLMIGLVFGLAQRGFLPPAATLFLAVGVLGGFTTFSPVRLRAVPPPAGRRALPRRRRPWRLHHVLRVQLRDDAAPRQRERRRLFSQRRGAVRGRPRRRLGWAR